MKYISKYSNGKRVSAAQYITELLCENKAIQDKEDLHYRFWTTPKWEKFYRNQIAAANKLLKKHSDKAICMALKDYKAKKIYSLRAPHLMPIIEHYEVVIENENKEIQKTIERIENPSIRKTKKQNNILSKLEDIDNDT
tara:strand:+ start:255 stop:671 length:417 start_codon:yes stop_codon:yes gene_type:complete